jgi:hypothetical protein
MSPGTNACLGGWISAQPLASRTYTTVITRGHWEAHTANCLPDAWFTNLSETVWTTNWWVVSSPGYSASTNGDSVNFFPTNCGWGTITFYGTWSNVNLCTSTPIAGGGTTSKSINFYVGNVQIVEPWKAVCTNGTTSFTLSNTCDTVTWEVSPIVPGGPYANGSTIYAGTNCGTYTVTARSTVNTNCTGSTTLYVVEFDSISADAAYFPSNNWVAVKTNSATDYVTLTANLCPFVTNAAVLLNWSGGGETVPDNPLQRRVHKNASAKTTVTASCCGNSTNVNIWILWGSVSFLMSDTNPPNAPLQECFDLDCTQILGIRYGDSSSNAACGRVTAVATITPSGVHNAVPSGWGFTQMVMSHDFVDGQRDTRYYDTTWQPDGPEPPYRRTTPDNADKLYATDAPSIVQDIATADFQTYNNFYDFFTWNGQTCCDTNNFWYFQGRWQASKTPQITNVGLGTGTITLPTDPSP